MLPKRKEADPWNGTIPILYRLLVIWEILDAVPPNGALLRIQHPYSGNDFVFLHLAAAGTVPQGDVERQRPQQNRQPDRCSFQKSINYTLSIDSRGIFLCYGLLRKVERWIPIQKMCVVSQRAPLLLRPLRGVYILCDTSFLFRRHRKILMPQEIA